MCSLIILYRPGHDWPVLIAANRDERLSRPWRPPARHWRDRPDVVAGMDINGGGTWQGINDHGVTAAILNRVGTLGPAAGKRSRGELVLDALDHADARDAAGALADINPEAYRAFNLLVADNRDAYWLRHDGVRLSLQRVPAGLSMLTARELNDERSARIRHYLPLWRQAAVPAPNEGDWHAWTALLASQDTASGDPRDAMTIVTDADYGTVSSSLMALPSQGVPLWHFAAGRPDPDPASFAPIDLVPPRAHRAGPPDAAPD